MDGIGLCGDGWHAPAKVESAWASGTALGSALAARLADVALAQTGTKDSVDAGQQLI